MIYETGTIKTTVGQTKITGVGTRWKDNLAGISEGCPISYLINNTVYMNTVLSINSDTEINLTYPAQATASNVKYQIVTVLLDSMSDGARKMLANQLYVQYFLRNMDTWMTQDGVVEVKTPTGEVVKLESIRALKKLMDGKFDKAGGDIVGRVSVIRNGNALNIAPSSPDGTFYIQLDEFDGNKRAGYFGFGNTGAVKDDLTIRNDRASMQLQITKDGVSVNGVKLMKAGDYGLGGSGPYRGDGTDVDFLAVATELKSQVFRSPKANSYQYAYGPTLMLATGDAWGSICIQHSTGNVIAGAGLASGLRAKNTLYGTANTTKDSNGNLKAASPIVKVFADHIETNDESEGVTLKKLHTGIYQLHGVLGLHSDASWGGINGGITIPCGINQLPLVFVKYDVLEKGTPHPFDLHIVEPDEDGDIVLYTSYRPHELPQDIQYERFKLYPEFLRDAGEDEEPLPLFDGKVELTPGALCDIPRGHWVDVRVNMPSNSIYNQKQAEAERLAKLEAERLAQEEAKRAAEEAERAEQDATEQVEQQ